MQWTREVKLFVYTGNSRITLDNLDFDFDVVLNDRKRANTALINVYNLKEENRNLFQEKLQFLELYAGYDSDPKLLFSGNIVNSLSVKSDTDWVTTIVARDGYKAISTTYMNKTYNAGITARYIVDDICRQNGLTRIISDKEDRLSTQFNNSISIFGTVSRSLRTILGRVGLKFSIQNGIVEIFKPGEPIKGTIVEVLTPDTGLVGLPTVTEWIDRKNTKKVGIEVTAILRPNIRPNQIIRIDSPSSISNTGRDITKKRVPNTTANGDFVVKSVNFSGSKHENEFYMNIVGVRYDSV